MKRLVHTSYLTLLGCSLGLGPLEAQPTVTIAPSPNPQVSIVPIDGAGSAPAAAMLSGASASLRPASFFINNQSGQPILSVVVLCTAVVGGKTRASRMLQEGFQNAQFRPVLEPASRLLVVPPSLLIPEAQIALVAAGRGIGKGLQDASNWISPASAVNVSIDSIIFASGEVDGPDNEHFMQELTSRKSAADSVLAAITAGNSAALSAMSTQPFQANDNHLSEWQSRFARQYLSNSDPSLQAIQVGALRAYPAPPTLFRAQIPNQN